MRRTARKAGGRLRAVLLLVGAFLACQGPALREAPSNRDPRGPDDVAHYIQRLQSPDRIRYLRPDRVVEKLALPPDAVVADLGSGPGIFTVRLARACPSGVVYAVDVEPRQLDTVRARMAEQGIRNVVPVLASYDDPHLPPGGIDLIFISDTYHHLTDRVAYLRRLKRYLRPNGRLAILEYRSGELAVGPPAHHKLPAGVRQQELREAGWELVTRFDTHRYHDFELWSPSLGGGSQN